MIALTIPFPNIPSELFDRKRYLTLNFCIPPPLVHLADQLVDELLTVTEVTSLNEMPELAGSETSSGGGELEGPEEVGSLSVWNVVSFN